MKKVSIYLGFFLSVYLFFVIVQLPAQFIISQFNLPKNVVLQNVSGSIWQAEIGQVQTEKLTIHDVTASLSFFSLLTLSPSIDITLGDPMKFGPAGSLTVNKNGDSFSITNADITIAANDLLVNAKLPLPVTAYGDFHLTIEKYVLGKPLCSELSSTIVWPDAQAKALDESVKLGDLKGKLACEQGAIALIMDNKNNLGLSYTAYMRNWGKFSGDGFIKPGAKFPPKLKSLLSFLGKPDSQGRYRLSF